MNTSHDPKTFETLLNFLPHDIALEATKRLGKFQAPVAVDTPNTCSVGLGYHLLATSHWSIASLNQAPIGLPSRHQIQFTPLECIHWIEVT